MIGHEEQGLAELEPARTEVVGESGAEKYGALEKMKIRCFQTAADYLSKGQYQKALEQIRYVVEIEPTNSIARDFERKVVELAIAEQKVQTKVPAPKPIPRPQLVIAQPIKQRDILSKYTLIVIVVSVVALAGGAGYFFAMREMTSERQAPNTVQPVAVPLQK